MTRKTPIDERPKVTQKAVPELKWFSVAPSRCSKVRCGCEACAEIVDAESRKRKAGVSGGWIVGHQLRGRRRALKAVRCASVVARTYVFERVLLAEHGRGARHHGTRLRTGGCKGALGGEAESVHRGGG